MENITYTSILDPYFSEGVMSVHFKVGTVVFYKVGAPGTWKAKQGKDLITVSYLKNMIDTILQEVKTRDDAIIEIQRSLSTVIQMGSYRIVIVYPPLSDDYEITVVKPIKRLTFTDYALADHVVDYLQHTAQGLLVCGAPGSGKTTFAQALTDLYVDTKRIVKTIEAPRDLLVADEVVQYSFHHGTHDEIRDILLLSRPDFAVYDEVRNTTDFVLYKDLRLTGIGLVGVIHATKPIDSIQRFIGTISLGVIPQVIDTILFIQNGKVEQIYTTALTVKTPTGMLSEDLARPVVEVKDFLTGKIIYELYSFGEQVVVMPLESIATGTQGTGKDKLAILYLEGYFSDMLYDEYYLQFSGNNLSVYVSLDEKGGLIGKGGANIRFLEKELGISISVFTYEDLPIDHQLRAIRPIFTHKKKKRR